MSDVDADIASLCDDGEIAPSTANELMRLVELFDGYGRPAVTAERRVGHLTWRVGPAVFTLSVSDAGFWGLCLTHVGGLNLAAVGSADDPESVLDFRSYCVSAAAYLAAVKDEHEPKRKRRKS